MDTKTAIRILLAPDPTQVFWETLDEWYRDYQWTLEDELKKEVRVKLTANDGPYPDGLPDEDDTMLRDVMLELVCYNLPADHYLKHPNVKPKTNFSFFACLHKSLSNSNFDFTCCRHT